MCHNKIKEPKLSYYLSIARERISECIRETHDLNSGGSAHFQDDNRCAMCVFRATDVTYLQVRSKGTSVEIKQLH